MESPWWQTLADIDEQKATTKSNTFQSRYSKKDLSKDTGLSIFWAKIPLSYQNQFEMVNWESWTMKIFLSVTFRSIDCHIPI